MKSFAVVAIALAAVASAQLENIPSCATACFLGPLTTDGCADLTDFACHCKSAESLFASVIPCVKKACPADKQAETITAVEGTCKAAGVPVTVPEDPVASSSAAAPSSSAAPVESSSAAPETTAAPSSSAAPVESSSEVETSTVESSSAATSAVPTPSGNGTSPTGTPSPTVSEFPGSAARATQAAGLIGAAALAFFAL